ncbi:MAG: hypothetical protein F6K17_18230 [Okeania sp. SIO3C4]|nr:hypothetical protein [Okeania sp. SIO3B3]NER04405.1 hypothetical protein [Okeania sp. SIO3C4]
MEKESNLEAQLILRTELEISQKMDEVIKEIQKIAEEFSIAQKDKKSPFRNVLATATESGTSLEAIKNYIRYQVGRSGSSPIWKEEKNQKLFASAVVEHINGLLNETTEDILRKIKKNTSVKNPLNDYLENKENSEQYKKNLHLKLTQLYLGYLAREHTALVGEIKANQNP